MSENIASVQCLHAIKPRLQAFSRTAEPQCAGYTGGREQLAALHSSSSGSFSSDMQGNSRMVSLNFIRVLTGTGTNGYGSWQRLRVAKDPYPYGPVPVQRHRGFNNLPITTSRYSFWGADLTT